MAATAAAATAFAPVGGIEDEAVFDEIQADAFQGGQDFRGDDQFAALKFHNLVASLGFIQFQAVAGAVAAAGFGCDSNP